MANGHQLKDMVFKKRLQKKDFKKRKRSSIRKKQSIYKSGNSDFGRSTIKVINQPLSNFDLIKWIQKLNIQYFRSVYSRDNLTKTIRKECGIINLNKESESGSHWICDRNIDEQHCEYFDSFGLIMAKEIEKYLRTSNKQIIYSGDEIQERNSVLCGYWVLYYLLERQKGISILDILHNSRFDMNNQFVNHYFLINYFKNII